MEKQFFLPFSPFPCVPCVSTSHSPAFPVPCPKFDLAALLYNMYNAYILKQRSIGASSINVPFPCQSGCKLRTGPHTAPQDAEFPANVNGLNFISSTLHSGEVLGALNWVDSLLAQFGSTSHGDDPQPVQRSKEKGINILLVAASAKTEKRMPVELTRFARRRPLVKKYDCLSVYKVQAM